MRVLTCALFLTLTGCSGCGDSSVRGSGGPVTLEEPSAEPGEAAGAPAYREAYDRAREEVTIDNARERLDTLNREIEEDLNP
ncbi:MAG: hypothetical protein AAFQ82_21480 [Myxococcota bacterium]